MEELGYYISRGLLENGKALANLANLVLPAVLTACDLADDRNFYASSVQLHVPVPSALNAPSAWPETDGVDDVLLTCPGSRKVAS